MTARLHPFQKTKLIPTVCVFCNWGASDDVILTPLRNIYHPLQLELESQPLPVSLFPDYWFRAPSSNICSFFKICGEWSADIHLQKHLQSIRCWKLAVISVGSYCDSFSCLLWPKRPAATAECLILLILSLQELGFFAGHNIQCWQWVSWSHWCQGVNEFGRLPR